MEFGGNTGSASSALTEEEKKVTALQWSYFIKDAILFFCLTHRFRKKVPNFSGALGFRHILYIFPTRYREIKCFKNKQACSIPLKSNSKALNRKGKQWRPQQTLGPKPRGLGWNEVHPQAEVMPPGGAHFSLTNSSTSLLCPGLLRKVKSDFMWQMAPWLA